MSNTRLKRPTPGTGPPREITEVDLNEEEARVLLRVATYHQQAIGPVRFLVQLIAPEEIKAKYRFVKAESKVLKQFAQRAGESVRQSPEGHESISFTARTLVAFWGRILASLKTKRSRRKLSALEVGRREALATKLQACAKEIWKRDPRSLEREFATRRPAEANWMREQLEEGSSKLAT